MAPGTIQTAGDGEINQLKQNASEPNQAAHSLPVRTISANGFHSNYQLNETPIRHRRPLRVICMGAGYSGSTMGIIQNQKMK